MKIDGWIENNLDRLFISYKANQKRITLMKQGTKLVSKGKNNDDIL